MDKQQAYFKLWNSFSIVAYDENTVPDDANFPRIDYQVITDSLDFPVFPIAKLWYRDTSWTAVDNKLKEIEDFIENMLPIELDDGYMNVCKGSPFAQRQTNEDDQTVKGYLLNLQVEFFTKN